MLRVLVELMLLGLGVTVTVGVMLEPGAALVHALTTLAMFIEPRSAARSKPVVAL